MRVRGDVVSKAKKAGQEAGVSQEGSRALTLNDFPSHSEVLILVPLISKNLHLSTGI